MDPSLLTAFLAPFLPVLMQKGGELIEESAQRLGDQALEFAHRLWNKLSGKVESRESAKEAADDLANDPSDPDLQVALKVQLKKLLEQDPQLAQEVEHLWREGEAANVTNVNVSGAGAIGVGGNVTGSTFITGGTAPKE
jgi:hypothetical protein